MTLPIAAMPGATRISLRPLRQSVVSRATARIFRQTSQRVVRCEAAPSLQLATAKVPDSVDTTAFIAALNQWTVSITSSGNMPLVLPLRADCTPDGFQLSLLRVIDGVGPQSVADIRASVEEVPGQGRVLMVRFYEGPGSAIMLPERLRGSSDAGARLKTVLSGLVDMQTLMQSMQVAIRRAASRASQ